MGAGLHASELEISSGPGRLGPLTWEQVDILYRPEVAAETGSWRLLASGLSGPDAVALGTIEFQCSRGRMRSAGPECDTGRMNWADGPLFSDMEAGFRLAADDQSFEFELVSGPVQGRVRLPMDGEGVAVDLRVESMSLADLSAELFEQAGLRDVVGDLSATLEFAGKRLEGWVGLVDVGFDTPGGDLAGFAIRADGQFALDFDDAHTAFSVTLEQSDGEMLLRQVYLPPPTQPLGMTLEGHFSGDGRWQFEQLEFEDPGALSVVGGMVLERGEEGWSLVRAHADSLALQFPLAWERWLEGPLSAMGLADIETAGQVEATVRIDGDETAVDARLQDFYLDDPQGRFSVDQAFADVVVRNDHSSLLLEWEALSLFGLPSRASSLRMAGDGASIGLVEPLRMPLLDGAVVIERLQWEHAEVEERELHLDARIEPLDLAELTGLLGFPEFGGVLSGTFPGLRYVDEVLSFTGGIDVQAFSGRIELTDLAIERPFGTLPALAAQVEFHRLDLAEVTGAFNFGHMEGEMSGWMRDLRLLDWRPVAMDARIFTHEDVRRRRISQRAVENLSNLGGAGGALITGTVLRVFDQFPYRRAGLACRLSNNICHIDGVAQHESGGFYIIQGRSLPRLDIIGHRRLVDWPQLMRQLEAMMEE